MFNIKESYKINAYSFHKQKQRNEISQGYTVSKVILIKILLCKMNKIQIFFSFQKICVCGYPISCKMLISFPLKPLSYFNYTANVIHIVNIPEIQTSKWTSLDHFPSKAERWCCCVAELSFLNNQLPSTVQFNC